jgi:hypothetical protein
VHTTFQLLPNLTGAINKCKKMPPCLRAHGQQAVVSREVAAGDGVVGGVQLVRRWVVGSGPHDDAPVEGAMGTGGRVFMCACMRACVYVCLSVLACM